MTGDLKAALAVKSRVMDLMKERVYAGDLEHPRLSPDAHGWFHYKDGKVHISAMPSPRDGWLNCQVMVSVVRRRWPFRKLDVVLSAGFGVDVWAFRRGLWIDYVTNLAAGAAAVERERIAEHHRRLEHEERVNHDSSFSPIDDAQVFKK